MTTVVISDGKRVTGLTYQNRVSQGNKQVVLMGIFMQIALVADME